jgi:hypothetical protein
MLFEKLFVLQPALEFYFRNYNTTYLSVPVNPENEKDDYQVMEFFSPGANDKIYIPPSGEGKPANLIRMGTGNIKRDIILTDSDLKIGKI